jgi:ABC-2 type transport system ATP-binding protein
VRQAVAVRRNIGVSIRGERSVYWRLTGRQNLEYFGRLYDLTGRELVRRAAEIGEVVGLSSRLDDYVERYSMGMKQRLAIACALIHRPRVLMLDEPTIGLDAAGARALRRFIRTELMQREKVTILYTTHYIHEAEEMSDVVGILHQGKIVAEGSPDAVARRATSEVGAHLEIKGALSQGVDSLRGIPGIQTVSLTPNSSGTYSLRLTTDGREMPTAEVVSTIVNQGCELLSLEAVRPSLEDAFVALTGGEEVSANSPGGAG